MTKTELKHELSLLKEKTDSFLGQFTICMELLISRIEDIDRCQSYLVDKLHKKKE